MTASTASPTARHALVTGGARGIGAACAKAFRERGLRVSIADIDALAVGRTAAQLGAVPIALDVTNAASVREAVDRHGPFDIVVNNAGADQHAFFTETAPVEWERLISVNMMSVLVCTHATLPGMQARRFGRIINVVSEAGRLGSRGGAVYAAAKAGVIGFTKSIARENARYAITANCIAPGPIDTPMLQDAVVVGGAQLLDAMTRATLVGRLGRPEEVAAAVAFLASEDAAFITGETLGVSGGMGIGGA